MESTKEQTLTKCHEYLEIAMFGLNPELSEQEHRIYLTGCIETLHHFNTISEEICEELLLLYGN